MRKLYRPAALLGALASTLTAGVVVHGLLVKPHAWLSTSSPDGTYTVELTGDKGRGGLIFPSTVRFNVTRDGRAVVENAYAHSGDWLDISFELAYPEHAWESENLLRFWPGADPPGGQVGADSLFISNRTGKALKYLRVRSGDMFLAFDVRPHSTLRLSPTHQPGGGSLWVEGEFADGLRLEGYGAGFPHRERPRGPLRYCVTLDAGGVRIGSPQVEGYDLGGDWERPNVPRSPDCHP